VVAGGHVIDTPGYFHEPTVVTTDSDRIGLVAEEQFGPAIPLLAFDTDAEAVARAISASMASAGRYGLRLSTAASRWRRPSTPEWRGSTATRASTPPCRSVARRAAAFGVERGRWGHGRPDPSSFNIRRAVARSKSAGRQVDHDGERGRGGDQSGCAARLSGARTGGSVPPLQLHR